MERKKYIDDIISLLTKLIVEKMGDVSVFHLLREVVKIETSLF